MSKTYIAEVVTADGTSNVLFTVTDGETMAGIADQLASILNGTVKKTMPVEKFVKDCFFSVGAL